MSKHCLTNPQLIEEDNSSLSDENIALLSSNSIFNNLSNILDEKNKDDYLDHIIDKLVDSYGIDHIKKKLTKIFINFPLTVLKPKPRLLRFTTQIQLLLYLNIKKK